MEDNGWNLEIIPVLLHPLDGDEEGLGHFDAEEGDHEPVFKDIVHKLVIFGEGRRVDHRVDDQIFKLVPNLLHNEQLEGRYIAILGHAEQRTCDNAATDVDLRLLKQKLNADKATHAVGVDEQGQFWTGLRQKCNDVILQYLSSRTSPWPTGVTETSEVDQQHLEFVDGEEVGDFTEPARVLSEPVDDGNRALGVFGGVLGVVQSDIGQF